jgi:hypothetical protein
VDGGPLTGVPVHNVLVLVRGFMFTIERSPSFRKFVLQDVTLL